MTLWETGGGFVKPGFLTINFWWLGNPLGSKPQVNWFPNVQQLANFPPSHTCRWSALSRHSGKWSTVWKWFYSREWILIWGTTKSRCCSGGISSDVGSSCFSGAFNINFLHLGTIRCWWNLRTTNETAVKNRCNMNVEFHLLRWGPPLTDHLDSE